MRKKLFTILRIVISLGLLIFLLSYLNLEKIFSITFRIWENHPGYLLTIGLGTFLYVALESYRLQQVLKIQDIHLPLSRITRYCFFGLFFNNFMPTTIGGDLAKGFYIAQDSGKKIEPFVALVVIRIIGGICLTSITVVALFAGYHLLPNKTPIFMVALLLAGTTFMLAFLTRRKLAVKFLFFLRPFKSKRLRKEIIGVYRLFHSHQHFPVEISLATLATLGIEFLFILFNFLIVRGLGYPGVPLSSFLLFIPLIAVATMIPSLNGLGVREGAYIYFFGPLIGKDGAGALSLIILLMVIFLGLTGGIVFALSGTLAKSRPPPRREDFN